MPEAHIPNLILLFPDVIFSTDRGGDGSGVIVYGDGKGGVLVKKVPYGPGPDPWRYISAAGRMLATLDGVSGTESVAAETAKSIYQQASRLMQR
jgi:hypothetical protein